MTYVFSDLGGAFLISKFQNSEIIPLITDEFSILKLWKHIEGHFMPDEKYGIEVGHFFHHRAAEKELRKRKKADMRFTVGLHANDVWSTGYFNTQMKVFAKWYGFVNVTRCPGQGKRAEGV